jgi:hypothetical protein
VASFATLDVYLPSDVANNLVTRRATSAFVSLADVSSVPLVGASRLAQLEGGARAEGFIFTHCVGILDGVALSTEDEARVVALVNSISSSELHDVLPNAWTGAENLLFARPFTSARGISATAGIGSVGFRNIRNAATLSRPLENLIDAVNALPEGHGATIMARHFDWWELATTSGGYRYQAQCFGLEPSSQPQGASVRPYLANAAEVRTNVENAVSYATINGPLPSNVVQSGLANLDALIAGRSFKGCYISYSNDPWSGHNMAMFIDTVSGFSIMTDTYWVE